MLQHNLEIVNFGDLLPYLRGSVFHVTLMSSLVEIIETDVLQLNSGNRVSPFGNTVYGYFRIKGCISFFDYRRCDTQEWEEHAYKCLPTLPLKYAGPIAILYLAESEHHKLLSWEEWKRSGSSYRVVPHVECEQIFRIYRKKEITEPIIRNLHLLFYNRIDKDTAGVYRKIRVLLTGSRYPLPAPEKLPALIKALVRKSALDREKLHPVHFAAKFHKDIVFIHPFVDGNGRMARLLMNLILIQSGYMLAIIPPILRAKYIAHLEEAHVNDTNFLNFVGEAVRETQKDYLRLFK